MCCIAPFITTYTCCSPVSISYSKWHYVVFWFKFVVCCTVGNGVIAWARDFWIIVLQRNFYIDRYRSNTYMIIKSPYSAVLLMVQYQFNAQRHKYLIHTNSKLNKLFQLINLYYSLGLTICQSISAPKHWLKPWFWMVLI